MLLRYKGQGDMACVLLLGGNCFTCLLLSCGKWDLNRGNLTLVHLEENYLVLTSTYHVIEQKPTCSKGWGGGTLMWL